MDGFCCETDWDAICLDQVAEVCGIDCEEGLQDCGMLFSGTAGYYHCAAGLECVFGFDTTQGSCNTVCLSQGTECVATYNNDSQCGFGVDLGCDANTFMSAICICSNGCGDGPPCGAGTACADGSCV